MGSKKIVREIPDVKEIDFTRRARKGRSTHKNKAVKLYKKLYLQYTHTVLIWWPIDDDHSDLPQERVDEMRVLASKLNRIVEFYNSVTVPTKKR